ncbi:MAG: thioredoxin domain-containing protein [Bacteroidia bacterium]|nr:thioredoxin domain-containing protein [Bacteroidia bacterium]
MTAHKHTNKLIHASSPYLLQHAHNPVNWFEWGEEATEKAKKEDKLILVSIGYSSCHWCHVMEHECFEKEDTAAIMNEHFICIKVDREERPDVDQIYMDAIQLLTGRGGWPLNVFTLPDGRPLHGGTYFPKKDWENVLISLADFYLHKTEEAVNFAEDLSNGIRKLDTYTSSDEQQAMAIVTNAVSGWQHNFDLRFGGYSGAPKFPMPNNWEFFLQYHYFTREVVYKDAVLVTLNKMADGGIYDALAGGFARYSTDSFWKAPHFEKMLYDNAQLMVLYAKAFSFNKNKLYEKVVDEIHCFILNEMTSGEGGFYSALDADSEGVEGKFYVWKQEELKALLGDNELIYSLYYSIDTYGNWEEGNNILYKTRSREELEKLTGKSIQQVESIIDVCNKVLLVERNKRIRPGLDDKIICSWNALMIKGYVQAYKVFVNPAFLKAATRAADFLTSKLWVQKQLFRIYKNGKSSIPAFAEDYACLCEALLVLYEATGEENYLILSHELLVQAIDLFYSEEKKLFYFKSKKEIELITRKIDVNDDVIPSANSILAKCLQAHGFYFDKPAYFNMIDEMISMVQEKMTKFPTGFSNWMQLIQQRHEGLYQIIVSGPAAAIYVEELNKHYMPNVLIGRVTKKSDIPLLADKQPGNQTLIYVCKDKVCKLPVSTVSEALSLVLTVPL